jgi:TM2 domain-containing membrane protein YozV
MELIMRYKVKLKDIENTFNNAWLVACSEIPTRGIGREIENYFWKKYKLLLVKRNPKTQSVGWIWSHLVFKSRASYVLFMLEWN